MTKSDYILFWKTSAEKDRVVIHNLVRLTSQTKLKLTPDNLLFLDKMNDFQMEGRYPDYQFTIYKVCTPALTEEILKEAKLLYQWLLNQLP